jgi:putative transposase
MRLSLKDRDYEAFEEHIEKTLDTCPMRICDYCLMPNCWHFVLWPAKDGELAAFMQKLTATHVRNWQENHRRVGMGHVYQGRYKSLSRRDGGVFLECRVLHWRSRAVVSSATAVSGDSET